MDTIKIPPFEDGGIWDNPFNDDGWRNFRVGTCKGAYRDAGEAFELLAIFNTEPGNGHLNAVFAWFYKSCKKHGRALVVKEVMNDHLRDKLIKMGFTCKTENDYIKRFDKCGTK